MRVLAKRLAIGAAVLAIPFSAALPAQAAVLFHGAPAAVRLTDSGGAVLRLSGSGLRAGTQVRFNSPALNNACGGQTLVDPNETIVADITGRVTDVDIVASGCVPIRNALVTATVLGPPVTQYRFRVSLLPPATTGRASWRAVPSTVTETTSGSADFAVIGNNLGALTNWTVDESDLQFVCASSNLPQTVTADFNGNAQANIDLEGCSPGSFFVTVTGQFPGSPSFDFRITILPPHV